MDIRDCPISSDSECDFTKHELLFWFYMLRREPDAANRKHVIRMGVQHGVLTETLASVLVWEFGLESA